MGCCEILTRKYRKRTDEEKPPGCNLSEGSHDAWSCKMVKINCISNERKALIHKVALNVIFKMKF